MASIPRLLGSLSGECSSVNLERSATLVLPVRSIREICGGFKPRCELMDIVWTVDVSGQFWMVTQTLQTDVQCVILWYVRYDFCIGFQCKQIYAFNIFTPRLSIIYGDHIITV